MLTRHIPLMAALLLAVTAAADIDAARMQRDLRVMEGVLRNLHGAPAMGDAYIGPGQLRARGLHLPGYGALFIAEGPLPGTGPKQHTQVWVDKDGRTNIVKRVEQRDDGPSADQKPLEAARRLLGEFLGQYAASIGQLRDDEHVSVFYRPSPRFMLHVDGDVDFDIDVEGHVEVVLDSVQKKVAVFDTTLHQTLPAAKAMQAQIHQWRISDDRANSFRSGQPQELPALIVASAKKSDLDAYRRGRIDEAALAQRLLIEERNGDGDKKIDIMAAILDRSLGDGRHPAPHKTQGIYQKDLGALFMLSAPLPRPGRAADDALDRLKRQLLDAVADYGATLSPVAADEQIVIDVRLAPAPFGPGAKRHLLMQVKKSAVDAYSRGKLDRAGFENKVEWKSS